MNARHSVSAALVLALVSSVSSFAQGTSAIGSTAASRWYVAAIGGAVSRPPTEPVFGVEVAENVGRHGQAYATFSYFENLMDHRRAFPPGQVRHADQVSGLVLPGRPSEHSGDSEHEKNNDGRDRHRARYSGGAGRPVGDTASGPLDGRADAVPDCEAGAARHALDDPAAGNEGGRQRGEPEDEARSEADGAGGASDRPHAHQAISSISRQRTGCDAYEDPLHHAFRPGRWC